MPARARSTLLAILAASLAGTAVISPLVANVVVAVTVLVLGVCVARARREERLLRRTRTWLLAAIAAGFVSSVLSVLQEVAGPTGYPAPSDLVGLLYIPFTVVALTRVPLNGRRKGFRARALADGGIAASSLWFLLAPSLTVVADRHHEAIATATALAFPLGDVFIVAAALTILARCALAARHVVLWLAVGLTAIAAADLGYAIAPSDGGAWRRLVFQVGLTALTGAAVGRSPVHLAQREPHHEAPQALGVLPFLPFLGCLVYSSDLLRQGLGLPPEQMAPAVAVALALLVRQLAGGRDKERLVVELAAREAHLKQELRRDPLTGVGNRRDLQEALERALADGRHGTFVLAVIDLDDFKLINDNHGHETGDQVLRHVANRLLAAVRAGDVVARLGGDEFAVLLHGSETTDGVAERFLRALEQPVVLERRQFRLSASIGVILSQQGDSIERLLADADGAMYEAKEDRAHSTVVSLDAGGRLGVARRSQVREDIAEPSLEQFAVHYQPVVELSTGRIRGFEALLRWNHPDIGPVPPDLFVPLAEQCGSIEQLGDFVLTTALRDLATLAALAPGTRFAMGVNVSPRQLATREFAERATELLSRAGIEPDQLVVEITEHAFEADLDPMRETVSRLIAAGVSVGVDDFGTGYSSLRYLQRLEIDVLKIDRSFVAEAGDAARPQQLIQGIMALAQQLNLQVIAEGIETAEQLAYLQAAGCELGQGYLFSPPVAVPDLARLVRQGTLLPRGSRELPGPRVPDEAPVRFGG